MPKGVPLTEEIAAQRRREILDTAVKLFLEKGFLRTSMREIADAAGAGKSTLYDYFQTKEQILAFVFEEALLAMLEETRAVAALPLPAEERLRQMMLTQLKFMQANTSLNMRLAVEAQHLSNAGRQRMHEIRWAHQDLIRGVIAEGIAQGRFRQMDALVTARLLNDSLGSVLYTSRPSGSAEEMLAQVVDIILRGIAK